MFLVLHAHLASAFYPHYHQIDAFPFTVKTCPLSYQPIKPRSPNFDGQCTALCRLQPHSEFSLENEVFKLFFCGQTVGKYVTFVAAMAAKISLWQWPQGFHCGHCQIINDHVMCVCGCGLVFVRCSHCHCRILLRPLPCHII